MKIIQLLQWLLLTNSGLTSSTSNVSSLPKVYPQLMIQQSPYDSNGWHSTSISKINFNKNSSVVLASFHSHGGPNLGANWITSNYCYTQISSSPLTTDLVCRNERDGLSFHPEYPQASFLPTKRSNALSLTEMSPWGDYVVLQGSLVCGLFVIHLKKNISAIILPPDAGCLAQYTVDWLHGVAYLVYAQRQREIQKVAFPPNGGQLGEAYLKHKFSAYSLDTNPIISIAGDFITQRIYWLTSRKLFVGDMDGNVRQLLDKFALQPSKATLQYYAGKLYWIQSKASGSTNMRSLAIYDILTGFLDTVDSMGLTTKPAEFFMVLYEDRTENIPNGCDQLDCSHLCLPLYPSKFQCICPWGLTLVDGKRCEGIQLGILLKDTSKEGNGGNVLIRDLAEIPGGKKSGRVPFQRGNGTVKTGFARRTKENETEFCFLETAYAPICVQLASGKLPAGITKNPQTMGSQKHRIVSAHAVSDTDYVAFLVSSEGCLQSYTSVTGTTWTLTCSEGLGQGQIVVDWVNWVLFWEDESQGGYQTSLTSDLTFSFHLFPPSVQRANDASNLMAVDPKQEVLYSLSRSAVSEISYRDEGHDPLSVYDFTEFDGSDVRNLVFSSGRLFWITHYAIEAVDLVSILNPNKFVRERVLRSDAGVFFSALVVFSSNDDAVLKNSVCYLSNCSHFCISRGENYTCFCPQELPVLINGSQCTMPRILIETMDSKHTTAERILGFASSPGSFWLNKVQSINRESEPPFNTPKIYFADTEIDALCRKSAFYTTKLLCTSLGDFSTAVYQQNETFTSEVMAIGEKGSVIFWRSPKKGCVEMSSIKFNNPIKSFCVNIRSSDPFVIDTRRNILFWCDEKVTLFLPMDASERPILWLPKQPGWDDQCKSLTVNEFRGELYVILGSTIILVEYAQLLLRYRHEHEVAHFQGSHANGLEYWADNLFWINGLSGPGEYIFTVNIERHPNGKFYRSGSPRRVYTSPEHRILQLRIFEPTFELQTWDTSCDAKSCVGICLLASALPPVDHHSAICSCPSEPLPNGAKCDANVLTSKRDGARTVTPSQPVMDLYYIAYVAVVFLGIIAVTIVFSVVRWNLKERKKRRFSLQIQQLIHGESANAYSTSSLSEKAALLPLKSILPPESISFDSSKVLGQGNFGIVYEGKYNDESVALKTLKLSLERDVREREHILVDFIKEMKVMQYIGSHEHIIKLYGAEISGIQSGKVFVILELSPMGNLQEHLRKMADAVAITTYDEQTDVVIRNARISSAKNLNLMVIWSSQIAKAMGYLEKKRVVHGDLATRNVLVFDDGKKVKISDFGLSRNIYQSGYYKKKYKVPIPFRWAALETLERREFSTRADVWSYGVTVWEIFTLGNLPYCQYEWDDEFLEKLKGGMRLLKPASDTMDMYEKIMIPCWHAVPLNRPTFIQIQQLFDEYLKTVHRALGSYAIVIGDT